jgi:predicted DNA-binding transcriptional regulator YafY
MAMVVHLQGRRLVRAEDLATHFEISVRTVYRDLAALGEAGIPIVGEAGVGYSLLKGYHLPPVMFTSEEASALSLSGKLVEHLTDASLRKQMTSALLKIRSVLPRDRQDYLDRLERSTMVVPYGSAKNPRLASEALIPIQRAIAERRVLHLRYRNKDREEITTRDVEPLGLIYYADNWHLIGYCRLRREIRQFRTDRILKLAVNSETFLPHENFSLKAYLEACPQKKDFELVQICFHGASMERVRREWLGGPVEEEARDDGRIQVSLLACCIDWLVGWILSFGLSAEVLSPKHVKDRVAGLAEKIARQYASQPRAAAETRVPAIN